MDEVIEAKGWDLRNFKKNPVIMYAHDYRTLPIGRAPRVWISGDKLKNIVEFPPEGTYEFADIVERLVNTGFLKAESVGFIPKRWETGEGEKEPKRTYTKQELLEISIVPVPAHQDALRDAVEEGVITAKQMEYAESEINQDEEQGEVNEELASWLSPITKPEEDNDWIRIPIRDCKVTATIDISKKEGIKALYCGKEKQVRTYMFDKRDPYNWTMAKAKKWVEDHKSIEEIPEDEIEIEEKVITQAGVKDELDYIKGLIEDVGLNEEAMEEAWELMRDIMRLAGNDIPEDIRDTIGVTITEQQELKVRDAINYLEEYLAKTNVPEQTPKSEEPSEDKEEVKAPSMQEIAKMVAVAVKDEIGRLRGKVS